MSKPSSDRVYIIDPLRFLAAFGVMIYHLTYRAPTIDHLSSTQFPEINGWTRYLHLSVELFFIISGFVISYSAQGKTAKQFAWSRFVRLYPAYWLCVILTFSICHTWWRPHFTLTYTEGLINLTMLQGFIRVPHVDLPYWTLAEELRFYGLVFVLLLFKQGHRLLPFAGLWVGLAVIDYFVHLPLAHYEMTLEHAPFFAAGIVYFDIFKNGVKPYHYALSAFTCGAGVMRFLEWSNKDGATTGAVCSPIVVSLIIVGMHVLFWGIATRRLKIRNRHPWLVVAGAITYPLYLIHDRIGLTVMLSLEPAMNKWWQLFTVSIGACTIAYAIWRWWEDPLSKALHRFWKRREDAPQPALTLEQKT